MIRAMGVRSCSSPTPTTLAPRSRRSFTDVHSAPLLRCSLASAHGLAPIVPQTVGLGEPHDLPPTALFRHDSHSPCRRGPQLIRPRRGAAHRYDAAEWRASIVRVRLGSRTELGKGRQRVRSRQRGCATASCGSGLGTIGANRLRRVAAKPHTGAVSEDRSRARTERRRRSARRGNAAWFAKMVLSTLPHAGPHAILPS